MKLKSSYLCNPIQQQNLQARKDKLKSSLKE